MLLPLAKSIFVFCGLKTMPAGSLWAKAAMRAMIRLVWRQEGPTTPIAAFGCVTAYFSSKRGYGLCFAALSTPTGSGELVVFEEVSELFLVSVRFETQDLLKKINWS